MYKLASHSQGATGGDRLRHAGLWVMQLVRRVPPARWHQLAALIILVWLTYSLAQLFWLLMPSPEIPPARLSAAVVSADAGTGAQRAVDIDQLKGLQLFGAADPVAAGEIPVEPVIPAEQQIEDQAVDTKLNLVLRGVIASSNAASARAIIADAKTQVIYSPGDDIEGMNNVKLAKVLDLRVILDNRGQYESLWLYNDDPNAPRPRVRYTEADLPPSRSWEGDDSSMNEGSDAEGSISPADPVTQADEQDKTTGLIEQIGENLSDVVAFNIHREGGQVKGYRIRPGRNADAFNSLGLRSGDVVTAVNGTRLDNPGKIMEIYRDLGQASSASLEIERDGEVITVDVGL